MNMSKYVLLKKGLIDKGNLVSADSYINDVDTEKEFYVSTYHFNDEHLKKFKETGSVKGIKDVTTDKLWFDFDNKEDLNLPKKDAIELCERLQKARISPDDIEVYFSGNKGFHIIVSTKRNLTPEQVASICLNKFGKDLKTLDPSVYDAIQILRVQGTKNSKTGLYKIPLTVSELSKLSVDEIKAKAKSLDNIVEEFNWEPVDLPEELFTIPKKEVKKTSIGDEAVKPPNWKNCKWSLAQGNFSSGQRHDALMVLAATARGFGLDKDQAYYLCKAALKKQSAKTGTPEFSKEELWTNIIEDSIYKDGWNGGQYTCSKPGFLQNYCQSLGDHSCSHEESPLVDVNDIAKNFEGYAKNFEQNIVKTGIPELDDNCLFLTSTHNGVLGQPGSGKTTFALQWLEETSKNGSAALFYSLDMGQPIVYGKMVQKVLGCSFRELMGILKDNPEKLQEAHDIIKTNYANVQFNFKASVTTEMIRDDVRNFEQLTGKKVRLLVVDYLECLSGSSSDPLVNAAQISQQMKDIANEFNLCSVMLLQTQKHSTPDISDPLLSMKKIKGSSVIEQSSSVILTLWREGYNPKNVQDDHFISFAVVKNRFGSLWTDDFAWNGKMGIISDLPEEQRFEIEELRRKKKEQAAASTGQWE